VSGEAPPATVAVLAAGLACGLGKSLAECLDAYAGRRNAFRREKTAVGPDGLPPTLAAAMPFDDPRDAGERLVKLVGAALADAFASGAMNSSRPSPIAVLLPFWAPEHVRTAIIEHVPPAWHDVRFVQGGEANSLGLLGHAARALAERRMPAAMVCAVDSLANAERMDHLMLNEAMFGSGTPYGIVPGEAAAVLMLVEGLPAEAIGKVRDVRTAIEQLGPRGALRGAALSSCLRGLGAASAREPRPTRLLTDLSGPRARAEAFGVAVSAGGPAVGAMAGSLEAPSLALGDAGEAFGLVLACLALGNAPVTSPDGDVALVMTAERPGAAVVERLSPDDTLEPRRRSLQ
jgi:3-oxoacyl-[acyl-carrier-protein] synthase-1